MKTGSIGIIENRVFSSDYNLEKYSYRYLTIANDVSEQVIKTYPYTTNKGKRKSFYILQISIIEKNTPLNCMAIYLGEPIVPDELVSAGPDFNSRIQNIDGWEYHKVLITIEDRTEVCYLHENSMKYFTWY